MSGYLLDTNIVSELVRPIPQASVVSWIDTGDDAAMFLSVLTLGELRKGVSKLPPSSRRESLRRWLAEDLVERFQGRILVVDEAVALRWGAIAGEAERNGSPIPAIDGLIAATALVHDLTVATRNVRDLERCGVPVVNPWAPEASKLD